MPSSAERVPVKATYAGRAKRKRLSMKSTDDNDNGDSPSEDSDAGSDFKEEEERPKVAKPTKSSSSASMRPPESKGAKKVDLHLPGPSPKRQRLSPEEPDSSPSKKAKKPFAKPPSISSKSLSSIKPLSRTGSKMISPSRFKTPDSNQGENSSIAGSNAEAAPKRVRRTEDERIQAFKDDPNCGEVEAGRAYCKRCEKWLSLGKKTTYELAPWEQHSRRCGGGKTPKSPSKIAKAVEQEDIQSDRDEDSQSMMSESIAEYDRDAKMTEDERKALLEADNRAESVHPHEAVCKKCQKVVKLAPKRQYILTNWRRHQDKCSGQQQSSRVAMAERKLRIVNDAQAKSFTARTVECKKCSENVPLDGEYELGKWEEHKTKCSSPTSQKVTKIRGKPNVRPPLSSGSASTDATLVPANSDSSPSRGEKRARESEPQVGATLQGQDEDGEPAKKPRLETYVPIDEKADAPKPGLWGWFTRPFLSFASGFRESMT